jgi:predicted enzyme related to lactoylglutathione lyase
MAQHIVNGLGHFEVKGPDAAALQAFYGAVFGWGFAPKGPGYTLVRTPDGAVDGAIVEAEAAELAIGIVVADIDAAVTAAASGGGSVAMPVIDNGWVRKATVVDPAGNQVTLIQA